MRPRPRPRPVMPASGVLESARVAALWAVAAIVGASSAVAFAESYRGLFLWAVHHGVPGIWAAVWPLTVDSFVVAGELALFLALVDTWSGWSRVWPWAVTVGGLAVSVAGNIGHVGAVQLADRLTAAVPPVAAFVSLTVGLGVLKRVVAAGGRWAGHASAEMSAEDFDSRSLVGALQTHGIEDTGVIAAIVGLSERQVRRHKNAAAIDDAEAAAVARARHAVARPRLSPVETGV